MPMVKIVSPGGWDFDAPVAQMIKIGSRGLIGNDRGDFIKRASHVFLPFIDDIKVASDEVPVHLIALGASEAYGPNRNGDGFKEATCKQCYGTFEKFARFYRNHKNKDPQKSYGIVKKAAYNDKMRRVELLTLLNATKSAADRNGGYIADREIEKLARGDDLAVSMACRVPYDVCSWCGNHAASKEQYCKSASCKAGGCTDNLTRLVKMGSDVHHLHVDNPNPVWFDISDVFRPADRIAWGAQADWLGKAASDGGNWGMSGVKAAEDLGIMAPINVVVYQDQHVVLPQWDRYTGEQVKLAYGLDAVEKKGMAENPEARRAFSADVQKPFDFEKFGMDGVHPEKTAAALGALADNKVILPLRDFAKLTKRAEAADAASACMKGVYGRMISDGSLERRIRDNRWYPGEKLASGAQRTAAAMFKEAYSLDRASVGTRSVRSTVRGCLVPESKSTFWNEKQASDNPQAEELARDYAVYKLAALRRIAEFDDDFMLTARLSVVQNQVA